MCRPVVVYIYILDIYIYICTDCAQHVDKASRVSLEQGHRWALVVIQPFCVVKNASFSIFHQVIFDWA